MNAPASRTAEVVQSDALIIGAGVIGLSTAWRLAQAGVRCIVLDARRVGAASGAAAGLLAPSIGTLPTGVQAFFDASLAMYDDFVAELREFDPTLAIVRGLLEIAGDSAGNTIGDTTAGGHSAPPGPASAPWLEPSAIRRLEPSVAAGHGGWFHAADGAIDAVRLVAALRRAAESAGARVLAGEAAARIDLNGPAPVLVTTSGSRYHAAKVVLAAGAWSAAIHGLPRALPLYPLKGQMLSLAANPLRHSVLSGDVYLVPRGGETVVGATAERAGFDLTVVPDAIEGLRASATRGCPALAGAPVVRAWAGLRPATPDMLPILGADPDAPGLTYACGHSKNGILLAPATAAVLVAQVAGRGGVAAGLDVALFSIGRFAGGLRADNPEAQQSHNL